MTGFSKNEEYRPGVIVPWEFRKNAMAWPGYWQKFVSVLASDRFLSRSYYLLKAAKEDVISAQAVNTANLLTWYFVG